MRYRLFITALGAAAGCSAADAPALSPSIVQEAFGNTIVSTYPDGRKGETWLNADGSYTGMGRRHDPSGGHWRIKGPKICFTQARPFPYPFSFCITPPPGGLSAGGFRSKAYTGEMTTITLVHGHVMPS